MQELRSSPRIRIDENIELIDINMEQSLGKLINISAGGFMLLASSDIPTNQLFQLRLSLPEEDSVEFGAECLWVQETSDEGHFWVGFQIIDISEQATDRIESLIAAV
jgi:hypothetical protein